MATFEVTAEQRDLIKMLAEGLPQKQIALELGISVYTVRHRLKRLYKIFGASGRCASTELVTKAWITGVINCMNDLRVVCLTNDKHDHLLGPFVHFFNKYWPDQPLTIAGYRRPSEAVLKGAEFIQIADSNFPVERWSDGVIELLGRFPENRFLLMLEDYWLCAPVDGRQVAHYDQLLDYINDGSFGIPPAWSKWLRLDLSGDRAQHRTARVDNVWGVIQSHPQTPYLMSFQAAIWNKRVMAEVLAEAENPWQSEMFGTERLRGMTDIAVLGTPQPLLRYQPVWRSKGQRFEKLDRFSPEDRAWIGHWFREGRD